MLEALNAKAKADDAINDIKLNTSNETTIDEKIMHNTGKWWIPIPVYRKGVASNNRQYSIKWLRPMKEETDLPLGEFYSITNVEGIIILPVIIQEPKIVPRTLIIFLKCPIYF